MLHFIVCSLFSGLAFAQNCYFPNGAVATGNFACNPTAKVSVCCGTDSVCLDNKVCLANNQETIRGSCTDQSWASSDCPGWCTGQAPLQYSLPQPLTELQELALVEQISSPARTSLVAQRTMPVITQIIAARPASADFRSCHRIRSRARSGSALPRRFRSYK